MKPLLLVILLTSLHLPAFSQTTSLFQSNPPELSMNLGVLVATVPVTANCDLLFGNKLKIGVGLAGFISPAILTGYYRTSYGVAPTAVILWGGEKRTQGEIRMGASLNIPAIRENPAVAWWPIGMIGFKRNLKNPRHFFRAFLGSGGIGVGWGTRI